MTPEQRALAAAFLAECWPVCREVPREERDAEKARTEAAVECAKPVRKSRGKRAS